MPDGQIEYDFFIRGVDDEIARVNQKLRGAFVQTGMGTGGSTDAVVGGQRASSGGGMGRPLAAGGQPLINRPIAPGSNYAVPSTPGVSRQGDVGFYNVPRGNPLVAGLRQIRAGQGDAAALGFLEQQRDRLERARAFPGLTVDQRESLGRRVNYIDTQYASISQSMNREMGGDLRRRAMEHSRRFAANDRRLDRFDYQQDTQAFQRYLAEGREMRSRAMSHSRDFAARDRAADSRDRDEARRAYQQDSQDFQRFVAQQREERQRQTRAQQEITRGLERQAKDQRDGFFARAAGMTPPQQVRHFDEAIRNLDNGGRPFGGDGPPLLPHQRAGARAQLMGERGRAFRNTNLGRFLGPPHPLGLYFNTLFGGMEVNQAIRASGTADIQSGYANTDLERLQILNQGIQQSSGGMFGSTVALGLDVLGIGPTSINRATLHSTGIHQATDAGRGALFRQRGLSFDDRESLRFKLDEQVNAAAASIPDALVRERTYFGSLGPALAGASGVFLLGRMGMNTHTATEDQVNANAMQRQAERSMLDRTVQFRDDAIRRFDSERRAEDFARRRESLFELQSARNLSSLVGMAEQERSFAGSILANRQQMAMEFARAPASAVFGEPFSPSQQAALMRGASNERLIRLQTAQHYDRIREASADNIAVNQEVMRRDSLGAAFTSIRRRVARQITPDTDPFTRIMIEMEGRSDIRRVRQQSMDSDQITQIGLTGRANVLSALEERSTVGANAAVMVANANAEIASFRQAGKPNFALQAESNARRQIGLLRRDYLESFKAEQTAGRSTMGALDPSEMADARKELRRLDEAERDIGKNTSAVTVEKMDQVVSGVQELVSAFRQLISSGR